MLPMIFVIIIAVVKILIPFAAVVFIGKLVINVCNKHNIDIPDPGPYDPAQYPDNDN